MRRKAKIIIGDVYHVFTKSIAGFKIFNNQKEFLRMEALLQYYQIKNLSRSFAQYLKLEEIKKDGFHKPYSCFPQTGEKLVQIISYCIMPTHLHLILKQTNEGGVSIFMGNILNSYSRYFNTRHKRKGPLWEGRFKNVLVETDEQLLHLTRYIHLNPVTAHLVNDLSDWLWSSYKEYTLDSLEKDRLCNFDDLLEIKGEQYREFIEDRISYQRHLAKIKALLLD
ncbi:MAG: transposase [Candidatus Omnitrophota bacterium]